MSPSPSLALSLHQSRLLSPMRISSSVITHFSLPQYKLKVPDNYLFGYELNRCWQNDNIHTSANKKLKNTLSHTHTHLFCSSATRWTFWDISPTHWQFEMSVCVNLADKFPSFCCIFWQHLPPAETVFFFFFYASALSPGENRTPNVLLFWGAINSAAKGPTPLIVFLIISHKLL